MNENEVCNGYHDNPFTHRNSQLCNCGSGQESHWVNDAQGIPLCRVCPACKADKLSRYRPEILSGYTQADVDEPIEPEDY